MFIPHKSLVTYIGTWRLSVGLPHGDTTDEMVQAVSGRLEGYGLLLRDADYPSKFNLITPQSFNVKLVLQVENPSGFSSERDVLATIQEAVWQVSGENPLSSSLPFVKLPGGLQQSTGQPAPDVPTNGNGIPGWVWGLALAFGFIAVGVGATVYVRR